MVDQPADQPMDPKALRALAHPLRWQLIDLLTTHGQLTATQCAAELGESVASCSYHLNMLAKYRFVEPAPPAPGRDKPWRMASTGHGVEGQRAADAATEVFLDHELARLKQRMQVKSAEPAPWHDAITFAGVTTWLTAAELSQVTEQLREIAARYASRIGDAASRPSGAREARIFFATTVAPAQEGAAE